MRRRAFSFGGLVNRFRMVQPRERGQRGSSRVDDLGDSGRAAWSKEGQQGEEAHEGAGRANDVQDPRHTEYLALSLTLSR